MSAEQRPLGVRGDVDPEFIGVVVLHDDPLDGVRRQVYSSCVGAVASPYGDVDRSSKLELEGVDGRMRRVVRPSEAVIDRTSAGQVDRDPGRVPVVHHDVGQIG